MTLYRPVGLKELEKIEAQDFRAFPPRLPEQPIFYPVTNRAYAQQIARDWNAKYNDEKIGYVTEFDIDSDYCAKFDHKVVGGANHEELWVPAELLEEFNQKIIGKIRIVDEFRGEGVDI
ncbi:hypothetical protein [Parvularcula sp. LCG005]|uniref:hypothetical protein n=1 Tax=Parvularcula sp. LCG005 TaxID=3078805 RepID=UPI00397BD1E7